MCLTNYDWFGSKACRVKDLSSITNLRNIKTKKYGWWRLDTLLKKDKFINLKIVNNGGWHFTEIKSPEEIYEKHLNDEHHDEFELTGIKLDDIRKMIQNKYIHTYRLPQKIGLSTIFFNTKLFDKSHSNYCFLVRLNKKNVVVERFSQMLFQRNY